MTAVHAIGCVCDRCWPATLRATLAAGARRLAEVALALLDADVAPALAPSPSAPPRRRRRRKAAPAARPPAIPAPSPVEPPSPTRSADDACCRVCGEPVTADNRAQRDLHAGCVERAAALAKRKERVLRRARLLEHEQLVARLARDRGDGRRRPDAESEADALTADELEVVGRIGRGGLATDGIGSDAGWSL